MQISKDLINQFNTPNTVMVISTYPRKGHTYDPKALAVAPVAKNKINAIKKEAENQGKDIKFVVVADVIEGKREAYVEDGHLIVRCWTRNNLDVYLSMQKVINQFKKARTIHFEHEFGIFGLRNVITAQLPFFFAWNRIRGRRIVMVLHQVIFNLEKLSGHLQINPDSLKTKTLNKLIRINYFLFGKLANELVVLDAALKPRLAKYVNPEKIHALPHGNKGKKITFTKAEVRSELNLDPDTFYLVFLGYVTWYKGADWLVNAFKDIQDQLPKDKKVELIVAGGESSSMYIDEKYMNFYNGLVNLIENTPNMSITGVLPNEEMLDKYAVAADLLILPYQVMMSASGIFAIAQNANTPVILSENLRPVGDAYDVKYALKEAGLNVSDIFFEYSKSGLLAKLQRAVTQPTYTEKLSVFTKTLAQQRTDEKQAIKYFELLKGSRQNIFIHSVNPVFSFSK